MPCPYLIQVENNLPNSATLLEIKSRISGLTWKVIEHFDGEGHILAPEKRWSDDYRTASLCNTTKHDFQLKFKNSQNNIRVKTRSGIKVKNGQTVKFILGQ